MTIESPRRRMHVWRIIQAPRLTMETLSDDRLTQVGKAEPKNQHESKGIDMEGDFAGLCKN